MAKRAKTPPAGPLVQGVEPDAVTRGLIALYLEPLGYRVRLAPDVVTALEAIAADRGALFVLSEQGLARAAPPQRERLREAVHGMTVVTLLEPGQAASCTRGWSGTHAQLTKPVQPEALLGALQAGAGRDGAAAEPPNGAGRTEGVLVGFEALIAEMEMEPALVRELTASFLERAPSYLGEMADGLAEGNLERVGRAAHTMKGMCGNLRFRATMELSDRLLLAARSGDAGRLEPTLSALRAAFDALGEAVRARWLEWPAR